MRHLAQRNSRVYEVKERLDVELKSLKSHQSTRITKSLPVYTYMYLWDQCIALTAYQPHEYPNDHTNRGNQLLSVKLKTVTSHSL